MFSFIFMFIVGWLPLLILLWRANYVLAHKDDFSLERRYRLARKFVRVCEICTNTSPRFFGKENLPPSDTGYILIANHQGKYDALAVMSAIDDPIAVMMEINQAQKPGVKQVMSLSEGENIDLTRPRQQLRIIRSIGERVRDGARFLIFPEGGYADNHNSIQNFHNGCFFSAYLARCPIVPVLLLDTYRSMNRNNIFARVHPEVHILPPIPYEEFAALSRDDTANLVRERLIEKMTELLAARGETYLPWDKDAPMPKAAKKAYEAEQRARAEHKQHPEEGTPPQNH